MNHKNTKIGIITAISIVIANMVGTGAFTSLGFQLESLSNTAVVLSLWVLGGIVALCGAFSYAEVGTSINKSGGEYTFLTQIYNPIIGYLSGWISLTVGFAAPIALSVIAFTQYSPIQFEYPKLVGIILVLLITLVHSYTLSLSSKFQNISTLFKILFIVLVVVIGFVVPEGAENAISYSEPYWTELSSAAFAVSLIYVSYSYSGWNAATYIIEEIKNPRKNLPIALITATLVVTILYTLLQYVLLRHVPFASLAGELNVGAVGVKYMLGDVPSKVFSACISLLLISGISAMVWVGPRVTTSIANGHVLWKYFKTTINGIPRRALWFQFALTAVLILTGTFEQIMIYCGVLLNISALMVVIGVLVLRYKKTEASFKSPLYPIPQIIFIVVSLWMIGFAFANNTKECLFGLGNLLIGLITLYISNRMEKKKG